MTPWENALSHLEDRAATWFDRFLVAHPSWDRWLEATLHAHGLHGPAARHLLKTRVLPVAALAAAALVLVLVLLTVLVVRWITRRRGRRRRTPLGRPHPLPR